MTIHSAPRRRTEKNLVPSLIISVLGIAGILVLKFFVLDLYLIEMALLLVVVGFGAIGCTQDIIRGLMSLVMLYVASGVAAVSYRAIAPFVGAPFGGGVNHNILALSFGLLTVVLWGALEIISRVTFRDTSIPALGILDNLGGLLIYLLIGVLVASLLFNTIGYGYWGYRVHDNASLRPAFNRVLYLHYTAQSFWFPSGLPPIYTYDLDTPREH